MCDSTSATVLQDVVSENTHDVMSDRCKQRNVKQKTVQTHQHTSLQVPIYLVHINVILCKLNAGRQKRGRLLVNLSSLRSLDDNKQKRSGKFAGLKRSYTWNVGMSRGRHTFTKNSLLQHMSTLGKDAYQVATFHYLTRS